MQGGWFLWYEEKTTILCWALIALVKKESSCVCHLYYWFWSVTCLCGCISALDDRYFPSCSLQFRDRVAFMQAWQVFLTNSLKCIIFVIFSNRVKLLKLLGLHKNLWLCFLILSLDPVYVSSFRTNCFCGKKGKLRCWTVVEILSSDSFYIVKSDKLYDGNLNEAHKNLCFWISLSIEQIST